MNPQRAVSLLFVSLVVAAPMSAQSAEFGRFSGGEIELMAKHARPFSGSLSVTSNKGYGATLGGTLVADRVWFFGTVSQSVSRRTDTKMIGQIGDRQNLEASFADSRQPELTTTGSMFTSTIPSSFLSLRYTGIVTDNIFFTASVSQQRGSAILPR